MTNSPTLSHTKSAPSSPAEVAAAPDVNNGAAGQGDPLALPAISPRRLRSETVDLRIQLGEGAHDLAVSLAVDDDYRLREVVFVGRGKIGHGLDEMLRELGIQLSRAIQGRNPESGEIAQ